MPPDSTPPQTIREFKDHIPPPVLIRADGTREPFLPADGQRFTLEELQAAVGGYVESIYLGDELMMLVDEDGKLKRLPENVVAQWIAQPGLYIFEGDTVVGDALILPAYMMN